MERHPDVAVVGGGIIGLTAAYELAKAGLTVEVLDRGPLGAEASWAGAGIIPPGNPDRAATPIDRLRALGSVGMPRLAEELREYTGIDTGYRRCGGIEFLHPHDRDVVELWEAEGFPFERLTRARRNAIAPAAAGFSGEPYLLPTCAQVRNPWHVRALIAACERVGVRLRPDTPVDGWIYSGKRVTGVRLMNGETVSAGTCVLAAGAWSEFLLEPLGQRPGVHPVRGQIILFRQPTPGIEHVLMTGKRYFVPRADGRVLVGSTEEPEAGFEKWTTAGGIAELLAFATKLIPGWADAEVEATWAGLRPGSADGLPYLGPVPGWDGVVVATGHFRAGVQLSVGTARVLVELLTGKAPCVPLAAFALDRAPDRTTRPAFRS
ncbi:MAG TPA: FAD-dependent oxidoreductase [Urbifossiella sp.]|nr:FAD-dependent oxidoreductase [Urbifossiella sp.]